MKTGKIKKKISKEKTGKAKSKSKSKKNGSLVKKNSEKFLRVERKKHHLRGFFYGWTFFILLFFIFLALSDTLLFLLLYPGWFVTSLIKTQDFSVPIFGSVLLAVLVFSFSFYCSIGLIVGLAINKIKYGTFFDKSKPGIFKKIKEMIIRLKKDKIFFKDNKDTAKKKNKKGRLKPKAKK